MKAGDVVKERTSGETYVVKDVVFGDGCWIDTDGFLHFDIPELVRTFGWPDTPQFHEQAVQVCREISCEMFPHAPVHER